MECICEFFCMCCSRPDDTVMIYIFKFMNEAASKPFV
uniref:Uncharacterized protein n=1 Tax=Anguilla anguilla TaxID=7936 RepID=A0A0E9XQ57_ANGAN